MPDNPVNVAFKRGLHSALPTTAQDGVFYLTTDTNRLYVGQGTELVELNKSITTLNSIEALQNLPASEVEVGQFYYIKGGPSANGVPSGDTATNANILVVCTAKSGNNPTWVQVNPDHNDNDNYYVNGITIAKANPQPTSDALTFNITVSQTDGTDAITPVTSSFAISSADISSLVTDASVGIGSSAANNNSVTLSNSGVGSNTAATVTISGATGGNVSITGTAGQIIIDAVDTKYEAAVATATKQIVLKAEDSADPILTTAFESSTAINVLMSSTDTSSQATVTVQHAEVTSTSSNTTGTFAYGGSATFVTGVSVNAQGHVTNVDTKTLSLPDLPEINSISADSNGRINITLGTESTSSTQDLYYTIGSHSETLYYNQAALPVYTQDEIDEKFRTLNGMTYKGAVPQAGLPTTASNIESGDVYMVSTAGTYNGQAAKPGDLFIAKGTESTATGYIVSGLDWDYIPSGDEFDSQYGLNASNNVLTLSNVNGALDSYNVVLAASGPLSVTSTASDTFTSSISYSHNAITTTGATATSIGDQQLAWGQTATVVVGAKADGYGHISEIFTAGLTMPSQPSDSQYALGSTSSTNGTGTITLNESVGGIDSTKGMITVANGNKTVASVTYTSTTGSPTVKIDHATLSTTSVAGGIVNFSTSGVASVITAISADDYGHVNNYTVSDLTLPDIAISKIGGFISGSGTSTANVSFNLGGNADFSESGTAAPAFSLSSSSLQIVTTSATTSTPADIAVDLVWGTF